MTKLIHNILRIKQTIFIVVLIIISTHSSDAQQNEYPQNNKTTDTTGFTDSAHHWYDIYDEDKVITPSPNQPRYKINQIEEIGDNILLYQKSNGGWPKNYDMLAILTEEQKYSLEKVKGKTNTTEAPTMVYKYSTSKIDRVVIEDPQASPIWARLYELGTNKPLFCNRDGIPVYSLAEVERERRSGYTWYTYEPDRVFKEYPNWQKKWAPENNVLR